MKRYVGISQNPGLVTVLEEVSSSELLVSGPQPETRNQRPETVKRYLLPKMLELRNHSPTGFNWGYAGSGPCQLALAILADHFGPAPAPAVCEYCGSPFVDGKCAEVRDCGNRWAISDKYTEALRLYQRFKFEVIARLDRDRFELTTPQIEAWLASQQQGKVKRKKETP